MPSHAETKALDAEMAVPCGCGHRQGVHWVQIPMLELATSFCGQPWCPCREYQADKEAK